MLRYEILMLAVPEITQDEARQLEKKLSDIIQGYKGTVISYERWGKYRLAYPVKKNEYGVYYLVRFEIEDGAPALLKELQTQFTVKLNNVVMRYMVNRLDIEGSLAYQRPPALEDTPSHDVDTFLRENKMEGLLASDQQKTASSDDTQQTAPEKAKEQEVVVEQAAVTEQEAPASESQE